ncbi:MAG: NfeD family protein [Candidatus Cyclobacteriaceae bacterium M3_2C_046]
MLDWLVVIILIVIGIILIIAEIIFIPGTTLVGILGGICAGLGVFLSFQNFSSATGFVVLSFTVVATVVSIFLSFKSNAWNKFALKTFSSSRVNEDIKPNIWTGDTGLTVSSLRPFGKAEFKDKIYEVKTNGNYLAAGTRIKVIKVENHRIIVEPITS